ncbi:5-formyltetrahydrofolate cyclo-ligase [Nocardia cyriacigeorgica]|uniref:5-formyltetrahydrofolate cyclo-ligase n=1 Tax=Nocardia cyriacigeorgica TaxID=135487 RepID=UPI0018948349|nr:5-formyltetrahydrofolate cyclo-ligase [Nocardia cyriacigeorgica]MBF6436987.1 5-formyltetrahydrofolate cyclo-ligase [Nocardia cyriacigeorgica]MBF6452556.1 5-formyltetrahydrofolate cyclo-ligase [Nocardia cyriacigeorgica]MBF6477190.1 5-formyltetrahydrofolate cyclo-ligase [Nocardia cyriacigeorgica]MBF6549725.1 5-formyltetrahydrofolate cyclo-ligase [Nocardia cyriacigeorgica]
MVITVKMPGERDKHAWRLEILAQRAAVSDADRAQEASALAATAGQIVVGEWVCAYVPVRGEPGSEAMLDALLAAGARVLLPVTGPPGPLDWAEYTGAASLRAARYGLLEPSGPALGIAAVARASVILVPALAVDLRGVRLGRGAGYYDRTLAAADPAARLVAVVRDAELVERLPEEPHDLRMGWALTPRGGLRELSAD